VYDAFLVQDLRLQHNPLGPDGAKHVGELLARNKAITALDLSDVQLVRNESNLGMQVLYLLPRRPSPSPPPRSLTLHTSRYFPF